MSTAAIVGAVDVEEIADSMRRTGFGQVENAMPADELRSLQSFARDAVRRQCDESAYLVLTRTVVDVGATSGSGGAV
jgi:hypothetical protein